MVEYALRLALALSAKRSTSPFSPSPLEEKNLEMMVNLGTKDLAAQIMLNPTSSPDSVVTAAKILRMVHGKSTDSAQLHVERKEWMKDLEATKKLTIAAVKRGMDHVELCCECFLLLSVLVGQDESSIFGAIDRIGETDKKSIEAVINELMAKYKDKKAELTRLSQSISHLPVEDIFRDPTS